MDKQKKSTRRTKTKKKPVKVVYISNPMKVKTSASEFRALVQKLTGQDSDPSKFLDMEEMNGVGGNQMAVEGEKKIVSDQEDAVVVDYEVPAWSDLSFEPLDDVFTPRMMDSLTGLFSSNLFYESDQVDEQRRL